MSPDTAERTHAVELIPIAPVKWPIGRIAPSDVHHLSEIELLTVALGGSRSNEQELLLRALSQEGIIGIAGLDVHGLIAKHSLSAVHARRLDAIFDVARRLVHAQRPERNILITPEHVFALVGADMAMLPHEELWCLPVDTRKRLIGSPKVVSIGDVDGTDAGPRAFFRAALMSGATGAIAVHNHPTGDPMASAQDRGVTIRMVAAGRAIDVPLLDHIIIGDARRFTSLRREDPALFQ